ncbi:MAG: hypothetical protein BGO69_19185 [Bacteroidetes bacterium 46-16]|nr:MAG: hypothetical protein BGO69_19185 [Bacteroidetes bacterium 46-16]
METLNYLNSTRRLFLYYKQLGEGAMEQLKDEELFWQPNEESNSIATIVKHLWGNMLSRWTDFMTTDGEKQWRQRDAEFENDWKDRETLMKKWNEGWQCLMDALSSITDADLDKVIYIRNEGHTVIDAINRQLAHYPSHVGQMIYIAKLCRNDGWKSLSIPRNSSGAYNAEKFAKEKGTRHFTDDILNKKG